MTRSIRRIFLQSRRFCSENTTKRPDNPLNNSAFEFMSIQDPNRLFISGIGDHCFQIGENLHHGSQILLQSKSISWNIHKFEDENSQFGAEKYFHPLTPKEITVEHLMLFKYLKPVPDLVFIGTGKHLVRLSKETEDFLDKNFRGFEVLNTYDAVTTFNILNAEDRDIVAAVISTTQEFS